MFTKQAILHALRVGAYHLASILIVGAGFYLDQHQAVFSSYMEHIGVPIMFANMIIAGIIRYLKTKAALQAVTIDSLPDVKQ